MQSSLLYFKAVKILLCLQNVPLDVVKSVKSCDVVKDKVKAGIYEGIEEDLTPFYDTLSCYIVSQRNQLSGNWAIANAVFSRTQRETLRRQIGSELVFIVLNLTKDCQMKRLQSRHGEAIAKSKLEMFNKYADLFEPAGEHEENAFNVTVTDEMTPIEVSKCIDNIIGKMK